MVRRPAASNPVETSTTPAARLRPAAQCPLFDHDGPAAEAIALFADDPDFVTALARGVAVLLALSDKRRRMSIAQVSHRTGIPRATVRRSLHTLEKLGFVSADEAQHFYLRPRVLSISHAYLSSSPVAVLALGKSRWSNMKGISSPWQAPKRPSYALDGHENRYR